MGAVGTRCPGGDNFLKTVSLFKSMYFVDLRQASLLLFARFGSNLCSISQHVIRARWSKHVVQENKINY